MRNFDDLLRLSQPEVAERLMRALELKGDLPETVERVLGVDVQLEDLTLPEFWWTRRGLLFHAGGGNAAVAAQYGRVALGAPQLGPSLAVVEAVWIVNQQATQQAFRIGLQYNGLNTANADQKPRDARSGSGSRSAFTVVSDTSAVNQLTNFASLFVNVRAGESLRVPGPWVLAAIPGITATTIPRLLVESSVVNQPMDSVTFEWRERTMLDTER